MIRVSGGRGGVGRAGESGGAGGSGGGGGRGGPGGGGGGRDAEGGWFPGYSQTFDGKHYFRIHHAKLSDVDIGGKAAQVNMFAVARLPRKTFPSARAVFPPNQ